MPRSLLLLLLLLPPVAAAQGTPSVKEGTLTIAAAAQAKLVTAIQRDTVAAFCATAAERSSDGLTIHDVERAGVPFAPRCGPFLPVLLRPMCFVEVRELLLPAFLLVCREGKFLVERARTITLPST